MSNKPSVVWSSIGRKLITGITGLGLFLFIILHLVGNLTLFLGGPTFNEYAHFLTTLGHGYALYLAEAGLAAFFVFHAVAGISVWARKAHARETPYWHKGDAGGRSEKTFSSSTMLYSGIILLIFLVIHLVQFRFGTVYYQVTDPQAEKVRDLYRLVREVFANPIWVWFYVAVMVLLGLHLRHGFWSMFQSLGANNRTLRPVLKGLGLLLAVVLALGFLVLPLYVHYLGPVPVSPVTTGGLQ